MRPIEKYLLEVKEKVGIKTDRALANALGMKQSSLYLIKSGVNTPSEETCKKLANIAGDPYEKVLLLAQVSKAPELSRPAWERIMKAAAQAGVFTLSLALLTLAAPAPSQAAIQGSFLHKTGAEYPLCDITAIWRSRAFNG